MIDGDRMNIVVARKACAGSALPKRPCISSIPSTSSASAMRSVDVADWVLSPLVYAMIGGHFAPLAMECDVVLRVLWYSSTSICCIQ